MSEGMHIPDIPTFVALEWLELPRTMREYRGDTFSFPPETREATVRLDRETTTFAHLLGQLVCLDGHVYRCFLVHRLAHVPPWRPGEHIGLIVAPEAPVREQRGIGA